jgi:phosphoribosylglycinamide formyltransferase-1
MKSIVLLASGSGTLAEAIFKAVNEKVLDCTVSALICDRVDAPVVARAHTHQVPVHLHPMISDRQQWNRDLSARLTSLDPDLIVSAGFMRILDHSITSHFPIINSHPSLLPLFPGAHAVRDALAAGASKTGTTVHWVDAGVDTGEVIAQEALEITLGESEESLHERIKILERSLIVATIGSLLSKKVNGAS